jgi:hypothetical protein
VKLLPLSVVSLFYEKGFMGLPIALCLSEVSARWI